MRGTVAVAGVILLVVLVLLTPTAVAQDVHPEPWTLIPDCEDISCIINAWIGGVTAVVGAFFIGMAGFVYGVWDGFNTFVLRPFFMVFEGLFSGVAEGLRTLGLTWFRGAGEAMESAYVTMAESLGVFGFAAPIIAAVVIASVATIVGWWAGMAFDRAAKRLPKGATRIVSPRKKSKKTR